MKLVTQLVVLVNNLLTIVLVVMDLESMPHLVLVHQDTILLDHQLGNVYHV